MRKVRVAVAKVSELTPDTGRIVPLGEDGGECALFLHQGHCYAVGSLCPHQNTPLEGAPACTGTVTCRRHGYRFDLKTGDCLTLGGYGLPVYETSIEEDTIYVSYWEYD
ncbi:MAG TPA: Rieske 2Fe-2S domain-containing protein [Chthonomonadaceae bacterium]|nr:Rieske 2Fe-2S domain-containing protein [Chthonomonadaceae bacterium]